MPLLPPGTKLLLRVAVSKSVSPTVIHAELSSVLIVGEAASTTNCSQGPTAVGLLLLSPLNTAFQETVPTVLKVTGFSSRHRRLR